MAIIGIDLGTTNSMASVWQNGQAVIIKNSLGDITTPSVVGIDDNGEVLVGKIAAERLISSPDKTTSEFKRKMGTTSDTKLGDISFSPEQLSSLVLKKIKMDAEAFLGEEVTEAVISVPAYFDDKRRSATKLAAEMSGLKVERLINEPSAAALAYLQSHRYQDGTYMVVDFGGGTLDVSIIDSFDSVMEILAVAGNNQLGGKDFNEAIYRHFLNTNALSEEALTPEQRASIYKMAEACKIALSTMPISVMSVNINDKEYTLSLDNNSLIDIACDVFDKVSSPIKKVLRDAHLTINDIEDIILVGGSCRMPTVAAFIQKITGTAVSTDINPDTAIGIGAGIFAGMKAKNEDFKEVIMTDICPFSLGVEIEDTRTHEIIMDFLIQRNSMLPSSVMHTYYAIRDNQDKLSVKIYQGESMIPKNNIFLGSLLVDCPPTKIHAAIGKTRLTYDINGILMVDVETMDGVKHEKVILSDNTSMSKAEIERRKAYLNTLKISPLEKEENRLLIAKAESMIEETLSFEREVLINAVMKFKFALNVGNSRDIRIARENLESLLD